MFWKKKSIKKYTLYDPEYSWTLNGISSLYRTSERYQKRILFYKNLMDESKITGINYDRYSEWKTTYNKLIQHKYRIDKEIEERLKLIQL